MLMPRNPAADAAIFDSPAMHSPAAVNTSALFGNLRLDVRVSEPYYLQLQRQIEALVRSGALPVGTGLPSERDLAEMLNVSRKTTQRCYEQLRRARLLASKGRRYGTVVQGVPHVEPALRGPRSQPQEQPAAHAYTTRVLERVIMHSPMAAAMFNRAPQSRFLWLVRLRLAGNAPVSREVAWYDLTLAPSLANWSGEGSVYAFMREHCGLNPAWASQSIEAVISSNEETRSLGFAAPAPCLLLKRQTHVAGGQQVEYLESTFRGDTYGGQIRDIDDCNPLFSVSPARVDETLFHEHATAKEAMC